MKNSSIYQKGASKAEKLRGSALITSVIFSFVIGALAMTFLKLATFEYKSAVRATLYSSSLNLAESGVEIAVNELNSATIGGSDTATGEVDDFLVDRSYTGDVRYVVLDADEYNPIIYAEGTVSGHPAGDVVKQVRVTLRSGYYPFEKGFSARNGITFSGNNITLDSYNSDYGAYDSVLDILSVPVGYGHLGRNKNDDVFVASDLISTTGETAVDQGNADIYGYVTVSPENSVDIGPNGVVTTYDSGTHDESRVLSDFYADFPLQPQPTGSYTTSYSNINVATTVSGSSNENTPTYYDISEISLSGNSGEQLTIEGHVVFVMDGDISVTGNASITINEDSSLKIYTADDVNIAGNGVTNYDEVPSDFYVYGTAPEEMDSDGNLIPTQSIDITGNGRLAGVVYAPTAEVTLKGGGTDGSIFGAVVGYTAEITGGSSFHFDEALRDEFFSGGVYTIASWLEMTGETAASTPLDLGTYF